MGEDIRLPIGALFTTLGSILLIYGLLTVNSEIYGVSLGTNVNLWTGLGMIIFGGWFLLMVRLKKKSKEK